MKQSQEERLIVKGGVEMIQTDQIETQDLWQSAFLMSEGGKLEGVRVEKRSDGRKEVIFVLKGSKMERLMQVFDTGQAQCNLAQLRANIGHLKKVMFRRIEEQ